MHEKYKPFRGGRGNGKIFSLGAERTVNDCPVCNSSFVMKKNVSLLLCPYCGFMMAASLPSELTDGSMYGADYFQSWGIDRGNNPLIEGMKRKTARRLLGKIEALIPKGRLLDVGCAFGHFLKEAEERGWDAYGVEISPYAASCAKEKFGDRIYQGSFLEVPLPNNYFHVVLMSDIIEHFPDPRPVFAQARKIISTGGILAIVTPNTKSLSALIMGRRWSHFHRAHLNYFNRRAISIALKNHGFHPLKIEPSVKWINLTYIKAQFMCYRHPVFTPTVNFLFKLLPEPIREFNVPLIMGDLLALARKEGN